MGTIVTFDLYDDDRASDDLYLFLQEAVAVLHEADDVFSTYKEHSPLSRLRRGEITLEECPREVGEVLELCETARTISDGWFDPWSMPGGVDPTGYVKGWAAQRSLDVLRSSGVSGALINAAGDSTGFGGPRLGAQFRIGIVDPSATQQLACIVQSPGAVATSGTYERGWHLIDPHTGRPSALVTSSIEMPVEVDNICGAPRARAARATPGSASVCMEPCPPVGQVKMGALYVVPNRSTRISTLVDSRTVWHRRQCRWPCTPSDLVGLWCAPLPPNRIPSARLSDFRQPSCGRA